MNYCKKCGDQVKADDDFCPSCGIKVSNTEKRAIARPGWLKRRWVKYAIALVALVAILCLFSFYIWQQVAVVVTFNSGVTESAALQTLSKYVGGIESRTPRDYDYNFFRVFNGFKMNAIEFATCRLCGYVMEGHIAAETGVRKTIIVEHPPTMQEDQEFYNKYFASQITTTTNVQ